MDIVLIQSATYPSKEEVKDMKQNHDHIASFKKYMIANKFASEKNIKQ